MENFEGKLGESDKKFYGDLAKKYGLEETAEHLIIEKENRRIMVPKWRKIPAARGKKAVSIQKYIQGVLEGAIEPETEEKEAA